MADEKVGVTVTGGHIQGVAGAGSVVIENFTIYNRAPDEPAASAAEPIGPCPYPGLAFFGPGDSALFFGRDAAIERLTAAVTRRGFTALVGSSGSGKSSVVLAGLAPSLHGLGGWRYGYFRIGNELEHDPFLALARALVPLFMASADGLERLANTKKLATMLRAGDLTLRDVFADSRGQDKGSRILLIADQFEETFTLVDDEATRNRFIDVLLDGFPDPAPGAAPEVSLILTMRADFYGRALLYRPLADALQGRVENLGPMSLEELREAIVQPAANANVSFDPGLVETLLDDVESKPGSLPLLQFTLREMWGRQEKRRITRESYDAIGGVQGALAKRAETIFADMTGHGANAAMEAHFQRLFTRLVTPGEGQEDTRRIADRQELGDEVWSLAQRLADEGNRLVVTSAPGPGYEAAEVVHEALIRNWPTLTGWINRDRAFLSWLRQIKPTLELWSTDRTDDGPLLRGGMLAQASDWFARRGGDFSPAERDYTEASLALRQREDAEREAGRQAEIGRQRELAEAAVKLAAEQRRRARMALGGGLVAVLLAVFGGGMAVWALLERGKADLERGKAEAQTEIAGEARKFAVKGLTKATWQLGGALSPLAEMRSKQSWVFGTRPLHEWVTETAGLLGLTMLERLSPEPVFIKGPHKGHLNFKASEFGYYNPRFVTWARENAIPAFSDNVLREASQPFYDARIKYVAREYYDAHLYLEKSGADFLAEIKRGYLDKVQNEPGKPGEFLNPPSYYLQERFRDYAKAPSDLKDAPGNSSHFYLAVTAGGFWVRRGIDGTDKEFFSLLERLLATYDKPWLDQRHKGGRDTPVATDAGSVASTRELGTPLPTEPMQTTQAPPPPVQSPSVGLPVVRVTPNGQPLPPGDAAASGDGTAPGRGSQAPFADVRPSTPVTEPSSSPATLAAPVVTPRIFAPATSQSLNVAEPTMAPVIEELQAPERPRTNQPGSAPRAATKPSRPGWKITQPPQ